MQSLNSIWNLTVDELDKHISGTAMNLWIRTITPIRYEDNCFVLAVHSPFQKDIIMSKYRPMLKDTLSDIVGFEVDIKVLTSEDKQEIPKSKAVNINTEVESSMNEVVDQKPAEYTFDNFIVGESNKHAHAACLSVARNPARSYNPLFIYGNTGLGKTHLLKAISTEVKKNFPSYNVLYVKGEEFTNDLIDHLQNKNMTEFKNKYRTVDVLLVDDIQFIAGKDSTQDEFFHTFNALYEDNKQIILASDRPPKDIQLLESRLRSRFESGIITDIYMPEYELKVAIIKMKAQSYGITLPPDVIDFVAMKIKNNIRQLEGVITKIMAFQLVSNVSPSIAIAQSAIRDIVNENEPLPVVVDKIILEVSREFDIPAEEIKGTKRVESIAFARQIAMYIMREITDMSLPEIGQEFNGKDHSTVHHSIKKIEQKLTTNPVFKDRIQQIIKNVKEH